MLKKIIKRGHRKHSKTDSWDGYKIPSPSNTGSGNVVVNHASRPRVPPKTSLPPMFTIEPLPSFKDVSVSDRQNLFMRKLQLCCFRLDFSDTSKLSWEIEIKAQNLLELVDFIESGLSSKITERCQEEMIKMIGVNIFRCLPPENPDSEEAEPYFEPSWPHLQLVYELLLRYVASSDMDTKVAKRYIDHTFVSKLLDLFDSDDPREREYLKSILHRIYAKFMLHRPFIRKAINNIFYSFIYETQKHSGIGELLEILASIINGFALPMKEEHNLFLVRALIPLHKPKSVSVYHEHLSYCVIQFVEKDYKLADKVIRGLLKYWPVINCQKELLFLGELEEVLEATQSAEFQQCMVPLFKRIARCLSNSNFQVSERALFLWNNEHIVNLIAQNRRVIFPIIFEALEWNIHNHWNMVIHGLTENVLKMFLNVDAELFDECETRFAEKKVRDKDAEKRREIVWKKLADVAARRGGDNMVKFK